MGEDQSSGHDHSPAVDLPEALASVDAEPRAALDRRLTVAVLEPPGGDSGCTALLARLAALSELRVLAKAPGERPDEARLQALLREVAQADAEALLVWSDAEALAAPAGDNGDLRHGWPRRVLGAAEDLNLLDACFTAPIGPGVTRQAARALGYEDGFADATPVVVVARTLVREALARAEIRRCGSSPPCYL